MKLNACIVFCTGRRTIGPVLNMLVQQLERFGHFQHYRTNLILSYDPGFQGLSWEDFVQPEGVVSRFESVQYLGPESYKALSWVRNYTQMDEGTFDILFKPRGYSSQKNIALLQALLTGAERIVLLDDDEYFVAPFRTGNGHINWQEQDVFGVQMHHLDSADITNGAKTGYFSPIPSKLRSHLGENLCRQLGAVLSIGNEVIREDSFLHAEALITYGDRNYLESLPREIKARKGLKFLSGGNAGFNSLGIRAGRIPPFFNPVGARGEDTILGTQLQEVRLEEIPVYTFHDPFLQYSKIAYGLFPDYLSPIEVTPVTLDRFCRACYGWVRYSPLLLRITTESEEYNERVEAMLIGLRQVGPQIDEQLHWRGFGDLSPALAASAARSQQDYDDLRRAREAWFSLVTKL